MEVEVDEAQAFCGLLWGQEASDRAQLDGAVATDHERQVTRGARLPDPPGRLLGYLCHGGRVLRAAVAFVRPPASHLSVAVVRHLDPDAGEAAEEVGAPQRCRTLLLTGGEGSHARRHPDQAQRPHHASLPRWFNRARRATKASALTTSPP